MRASRMTSGLFGLHFSSLIQSPATLPLQRRDLAAYLFYGCVIHVGVPLGFHYWPLSRKRGDVKPGQTTGTAKVE